MEDTHVTKGYRIERLIFVLTIAFCWAYKTGNLRDQIKPISLKKHGRKLRSIFREGFNRIRRIILAQNINALRDLLGCFSNFEFEEFYA